MLSYQHGFHAGNLADVHKHAALAWILSYMTRKDKPLSYVETHGGRGLYDLSSAQAVKTGEAAAGIEAVGAWVQGTPYGDVVADCRAENGAEAYPGSPWIASRLLRGDDVLHIAELHPQENTALRAAVPAAHIHRKDGFEMAYSVCPPTPRRGLMVVDPSYEVKDDYAVVPRHLAKLAKAWPVGVLLLWYPVLTDHRHSEMLGALGHAFPDALRHEVGFAPARPGHRMVGSGLYVVNPPWGLSEMLDDLGAKFATL
ncbi:23S rRNA (adenine(2030)-N(6))-methyltransferase RlmJ [Pseudooctadecabacter jejudonensis]|uniref:Ribosomal RNA large subunit methyltransferase J n=1 Tax=Pseudooctadecabacter jejudonensis TaxID=1391910 RepID=A0A1Y5RRK5_9RHOB|nr:23S rRNA (adenine(2030)-N(6))-methyltransferase RlmJ [Pseudooctadecabacter jejudonensis]SLN21048.1 Ribosomal RNA large subunit methyltransferase J [Pseudooctadecabacter jejudonensis]